MVEFDNEKWGESLKKALEYVECCHCPIAAHCNTTESLNTSCSDRIMETMGLLPEPFLKTRPFCGGEAEIIWDGKYINDKPYARAGV